MFDSSSQNVSAILNLSKGVLDCLARGTGSEEKLDVRNRLRAPIADYRSISPQNVRQ
jgi:hypothetical protein